MKKDLVIFGSGDIARLAKFYFDTDSNYRVAAFTVDATYLPEGGRFCELPVVAFEELEKTYPSTKYEVFVAVSYQKMNSVREAKYREAKARGYRIAGYVSSRCTYLSQFPPGENAFILEDNTIQPFVKIGHNVTLWSGNHVGHDSVIDDHVFVASQVVISGNVKVGRNCFIGVNATLRNSIELAPETLLGAGAVLMESTREKDVYLPERAKRFSKRSDEIKL